jgi:acetolactate synthase small subunit
MHAFHIRYRNTQGTLMRIINAASRRALDIPYVQATKTGVEHTATLLLEVNAKQIGQLCRDWHAIVDVTDVSVSEAPEDLTELNTNWTSTTTFPSASTGVSNASASAARA